MMIILVYQEGNLDSFYNLDSKLVQYRRLIIEFIKIDFFENIQMIQIISVFLSERIYPKEIPSNSWTEFSTSHCNVQGLTRIVSMTVRH